jgi:hypothetical protein
MPYVLLAFLVFMSVLIAAYFYLFWAKSRDAATGTTESGTPNTHEGS